MSKDCSTVTGFDVTLSASAYSALTGVIAGVLFTGIVLLVGTRPQSTTDVERRAALEVMVPTLFITLVASFLFGVIAGESLCRRGAAESMSAGSLFGVSAVATFQAISWMLKSYEGDQDRLSLVAAFTRFGTAVVALLQMAVTFAEVQSQYGDSTAASILIYLFLGTGAVLYLSIGLDWSRRRDRGVGAWVVTPALIAFLLAQLITFDLTANTVSAHWATAEPPMLLTIAAITSGGGYLVCSCISLLGAPPRSGSGVTSSPPAGPLA